MASPVCLCHANHHREALKILIVLTMRYFFYSLINTHYI